MQKSEIRDKCFSYLRDPANKHKTTIEMFLDIQDMIEDSLLLERKNAYNELRISLVDYSRGRS